MVADAALRPLARRPRRMPNIDLGNIREEPWAPADPVMPAGWNSLERLTRSPVGCGAQAANLGRVIDG